MKTLSVTSKLAKQALAHNLSEPLDCGAGNVIVNTR
jgi:hypothetical protein